MITLFILSILAIAAFHITLLYLAGPDPDLKRAEKHLDKVIQEPLEGKIDWYYDNTFHMENELDEIIMNNLDNRPISLERDCTIEPYVKGKKQTKIDETAQLLSNLANAKRLRRSIRLREVIKLGKEINKALDKKYAKNMEEMLNEVDKKSTKIKNKNIDKVINSRPPQTAPTRLKIPKKQTTKKPVAKKAPASKKKASPIKEIVHVGYKKSKCSICKKTKK